MSDIKEVLGNYSTDITKTIEEELATITPQNLADASVYLTRAGGKMLRPALTLITAEAVGGARESSLNAAAAIELIHTFSLIHDDIMDQDDTRRGMPSVHKVWGDDVAILAGDTLFSKAFELIIGSKGTSSDQNNKALATVADACVKICEGQALDMSFEERFDVKQDEYMEMIFKKTGALIAAATKAGAIMGGASDEVIDAMYEYGRLIGLAFQIQDDYLDLVADEETLGKPIGSDIGKGKMTIIAIKGLESDDSGRLFEILKDTENSQSDIDEAIQILTDCGAIEYARNLALESVDQAKEVLEILDDSASKQILVGIADCIIRDGNHISIIDFKSDEKIPFRSIYEVGKKKSKRMKYPLVNLEDASGIHYQIQLSLYAWMIQQLDPNLIIDNLVIVQVENLKKKKEFPVEYLKEDVEKLLKWHVKSVRLKTEMDKCNSLNFD